jgi:hypothetical protein
VADGLVSLAQRRDESSAAGICDITDLSGKPMTCLVKRLPARFLFRRSAYEAKISTVDRAA